MFLMQIRDNPSPTPYFPLVYPANVCLRDNGTLSPVDSQTTSLHVICSSLGHFGGELRADGFELLNPYIYLNKPKSLLGQFFHDTKTLELIR